MLVSRYGERDSFIVAFNPDYQRSICDSSDKCFFGDYPTLATIKLAYGQNAPTMWLVPQLTDLSEYCGCRDKLQGKSLEECAFVISTEFRYLKISELMLFFHRFKTGRYGRFYGSVDPLIITESLRKFCEERWYAYERAAEQRRQQEAEKSKEGAITREEWLRMKQQDNKTETT